MSSGAPDLEYEVLSRLRGDGQPRGSGSLWAELHATGIGISPATVGRMLHRFGLWGYTRRVGFRGRTLTERGIKRLAELQQKRERTDWETLVVDSARPSTVGELLDVLVARRVIEREIARLAALRATDDDVQALWAALDAQAKAVRERGMAIAEDRRFHETLADASGNRLLAATLSLIRRDLELQQLLEELRQGHASGFMVDHQAVVQAVSRHDPAAAEAAMSRHIDHLIEDVMSYCRTRPDGFQTQLAQMLVRTQTPEAAAHGTRIPDAFTARAG